MHTFSIARVMKPLALAATISGAVGAFPTDHLDRHAGNPLIPGYFADPCVRKFGDTYYLYATPDGWNIGQGPFCIWTSKDFVHWTAHRSNWPTTECKWAPSVVRVNGKYFMYSQTPCSVWVATSSSPLGPWTNPIPGGGPMIPDKTPKGTITLDGEAFIDDDGQAYLMYGTWWTPTIMKLNRNLISWTERPAQYFKKPGTVTPYGLVQGCMEAPYMLKRHGVYYWMYSDLYCGNSTYRVEYSTGKTPLGPWTYGANNPILSTNADNSVAGPGHHTVLEDRGKTFIVYHRHDNPHSADGSHRQVAADAMRFGPDGTILKVVPTHEGVGYLAPSTVLDTNWVVEPSARVVATASSYAGPDFEPANAADENNGTLWKAAKYKYPQWLQLDLGVVRPVKRIETDFEFPQIAYRYRLQTSPDGVHWSSFADRSKNAGIGPMRDAVKKAERARYVRITVLGDERPERPDPQVGIWNLKVYDGVDKPNRAPRVTVGPSLSCAMPYPTLTLRGRVLDDGLPYGPVSVRWRVVSGPGKVSFADPANPETTVAFSAPGTYVLKLSASDGKLASSATLRVKVAAKQPECVLAYAFDETRGTRVIDASGCGRGGLFASDGDVKHNPSRGMGRVGSAAAFNGATSFVAVPPLGRFDSYTLSAWVKPSRVDRPGAILSAEGGAALRVLPSGELEFAAGEGKAIRSSASVAAGRWTHVALVVDSRARRATFVVDGKPEPPQALGSSMPASFERNVRVGAGAHSDYLDGKLDELKLFRVALPLDAVGKFSHAAPLVTVADALRLPVGAKVRLGGVAVTFAPRNEEGERCTDWFFVQDPDGGAAMRVVDDSAGWDDLVEDQGASLTGVVRKGGATGGKVLQLTSFPAPDSARTPEPAAKVAPNALAKVEARVLAIAPDRKSLTLEGGLSAKLLSGTIDATIAPGNAVSVVGVAGPSLLVRSIVRTQPPIEPLMRDLQAWYRFDQTGGQTAADASGHGRNATLTGGAWSAGRFGKALTFNGTSDFVSLPDLGNFPAVTIAGWINLRSLRDWQAILHSDGFAPRATHLSIHSDGSLLLAVNGANPSDVSSGPVLGPDSVGVWRHIAVVYDSRARRVAFYVDGKQVSRTDYQSAVAARWTGGMKLGSWGGGDRFFDGSMDDVRLFGRALTDAEVAELAAAPRR